VTIVNVNTAVQRRRRSNAVSAPPPPVFRGGYQPPPPPPPPIIPLPPPPDLYETNRLRERVAKLERVNVVNRIPLKSPVKSVGTQTAGVAVGDRTEGRRARIEAAAAELLNPTIPIEQVGSEAFAKDKERQRQRRVRLVEDRIVDEETGGVIRPPSPPPPPPVADPLASPTGISRATTEDIRGNERGGTERIVKDHRGSFRDLRERMGRGDFGEGLVYGTEAERFPRLTPLPEPIGGGIREFWGRIGK
jgi:hypothetical protein